MRPRACDRTPRAIPRQDYSGLPPQQKTLEYCTFRRLTPYPYQGDDTALLRPSTRQSPQEGKRNVN